MRNILKYLYWPYTHNIGIQMKRKKLTKTFIMIQNEKTLYFYMVLYKSNSAL